MDELIPISYDHSSAIEYLEALRGYVPWLLLLASLLLSKTLRHALISMLNRVADGGSVKVMGLEVGPDPRVITSNEDLAPEIKSGAVEIVGNSDEMHLLFKSQGIVDGKSFKKSTKALEVPGGCIVQVSTEISDRQGGSSAAEALSFVPGVAFKADPGGLGGRLVARPQ